MLNLTAAWLRIALAVAMLVAGGVASGKPAVILVVGDSLSAEYGLPRGSGWVKLLSDRLAREAAQYSVVNASITQCGQWHHPAIVHLDYVGHAALTDRLLEVDPAWNWEPLAVDSMGLPIIDKDGGVWIRLTVLGVTRLGYGLADGKTGGDAIKEAIGDALRNAAMRFGAALDLWHKGTLHPDAGTPPPQPEAPPPPPAEKTLDFAWLKRKVWARGEAAGKTAADLKTYSETVLGKASSKNWTAEDCDMILNWIEEGGK